MLNLDTHILIYAITDNLTKLERVLLRKHEWCISPIVLWEIATLVKRGRIELNLNSTEFTRVLNQIELIPLSLQVCVASTELDFKSDPADQIIAATSIVHKIPLLTRDKTISKSKIVPFAN